MSHCGRCGKVCFRGGGCVKPQDVPDIMTMVAQTETVIGFLKQCRRIDAELKKRGLTPVIEQTAKKSLCVMNRMDRNAAIAQQLQQWIIKPLLEELKIKE